MALSSSTRVGKPSACAEPALSGALRTNILRRSRSRVFDRNVRCHAVVAALAELKTVIRV